MAGCPSTPRSEASGRQTTTGEETRSSDDTATTTGERDDYDTIRVTGDYETIQTGINAASSGDLDVVASRTYPEQVVVATPDVTIRGRDRNQVILHEGFERGNAIGVIVDWVVLENLTGRYYRETPFYWYGVEGFRGSPLTAYNNGYYGSYAYDSGDGRFEYSDASGHPDAGFYLGRNRSYEAVVSAVVASTTPSGARARVLADH